VFGRTLLERMLVVCERAGARRSFVVASDRAAAESALGRFRGRADAAIVASLDELARCAGTLAPDARCLWISGNVVLTGRNIEALLGARERDPTRVARIAASDGGEVAIGPPAALLDAGARRAAPSAASSDTLLVLTADARSRRRAEHELARALRDQTADTDTPIARHIDRRFSWRLSMLVARTAVTPNQITLANTLFGLACAWMFAQPGYWMRVAASVLFVLSVTLDGVDGEVARLKQAETKFGGQLDVITDNIVNVAVFAAVFLGCYRASVDATYLYLLGLFMGGFALCGLATWRAFQITGPEAQKWINAVHRWSGRDYAYLLLVLASLDALHYFAWATAFGTYMFALGLWLLTVRHIKRTGAHALGGSVPAEET
jgi:phosphatidylglycerophosphate synthase